MIATRLHYAYIIAHDEQDIWFLVLRLAGSDCAKKRCRGYKKVRGSFNSGGFAGQNSFKFTGRVGGKKLRRGKYRLTGTPSKSTRTGAPVRASFKIK